jgi:acetolactate synthase I/III small subunit
MMYHTIVALVEDKPGVLNRVASLFRRRAFNIESLTVGHTESPGISRMTIVVNSDEVSIERLTALLYKLVNVIQVSDLSAIPTVSRDLALIKVNANTENRVHVMQIVDVFRARIVDVTNNSFIIEITGDEEKVEGLSMCCARGASLRWCAPAWSPWRAAQTRWCRKVMATATEMATHQVVVKKILRLQTSVTLRMRRRRWQK